MAKKPVRVHVECATSKGYRWLRSNITGRTPPVGAVGEGDALVVFRPDVFNQMLEAAECKIVKTLSGARRKKR